MTEFAGFDLVLHHRYGDHGLRDLSGRDNHGFGELRLGPGRSPGSTAATFDGLHDRVYVPPSASLAALGDLRAELVVVVEALGQRRTLMEGYLSFAFAVEADGSLTGAVMQYKDWYGTRSQPGLIRPGRWTTAVLEYTSDGRMTIAVDGAVVADAVRTLGAADGVSWPFGLNIGAWPDGDLRLLQGRIEEARLWRGIQGGRRQIRTPAA